MAAGDAKLFPKDSDKWPVDDLASFWGGNEGVNKEKQLTIYRKTLVHIVNKDIFIHVFKKDC